MSRWVRIGEYNFDPESGELLRETSEGERAASRLPPQPARLLALLAERRGEVVTHQEIREALWPEVQVDFERGLHFCVRQVRDALGDSAERPKYIETLPRRGYRLLVDLPAGTGTPVLATRRRLAGWGLAPVLALAVLAVAWAVLRSPGPAPPEPAHAPTRLAILPFRPPVDLPGAASHAVIAEDVLLRLEERLGAAVELIGPTTTGIWRGDETSLRELATTLEPHYLVHGRYLAKDGRQRLLGELLRWPDGAHVWVEVFDPIPAAPEIVERVANGVAGYLEGERGAPRR